MLAIIDHARTKIAVIQIIREDALISVYKTRQECMHLF